MRYQMMRLDKARACRSLWAGSQYLPKVLEDREMEAHR